MFKNSLLPGLHFNPNIPLRSYEIYYIIILNIVFQEVDLVH